MSDIEQKKLADAPANNTRYAEQPDKPQEVPTQTLPQTGPEPPSGAFVLPSGLSDRYALIRELGSGTQGKVFQARRLADNVLVAIKVLRIDSIKSWKEYTLFHREAEVLASLDIPGIAKFYETCDCLDDKPPCSCIVQAFIEGTTLKQILSSGYRFSLAQVYDIALQLIDILEKLHKHDPPVIHRDIKPSNIIIQIEHGSPKVFLIDFGAVANPQIQSGGSTIAGTYGYMSPEQNIGRPTPQSDTYALAALLAYMLSGVDPADMKTQNLRLIIDPYVENHPPALVQTLRRMLEPDLSSRLADLGILRERFQNFQNGNYLLENEPCQPFPKAEFKKRLLAVKDLCAPQNLELWQNLPDIPDNRPNFPIKLYTTPQFANYLVEDNERTSYLPYILATLIVMLMFLAVEVIFVGNGIERFVSVLVLALLIFISIYYFANTHDHKLTRQNLLHVHWDRPPIQKNHAVKSKPCARHLILYDMGRKTIATITKIAFMPTQADTQDSSVTIISDDQPDVYSYQSKSPPNYMFPDTSPPRLEEPPTFWIWYKFNPPDDNDANDIIHFIDIHRDPAGHFKVGDPLPILYLLEPRYNMFTNRNEITVTYSMPYPFPLNDLERPSDYIASPSVGLPFATQTTGDTSH